MTERPPEAPERLEMRDDRVGRLLRAADAGFRPELDEAKAFRTLEGRRRKRNTDLFLLVMASAAAGVVAAAFGLWPSKPVLEAIEAEHAAAVAVAPREPAPSVPAPLPLSPSAPAAVSLPAEASPTPSHPPVTEHTCRGLVEARRPGEAAHCFEALGRSSSTPLVQQVAWLEAARLQLRELKAPALALSLLDKNKNRYPEGPLRAEVEELEIQALSASGRHTEALEASEKLLSQPWGRPLSSSLHLWRGRTFEERLGDCSRAVSAYVALVGEAGARGDEAEFRRAACLERLGRTAEAASAFRMYLQRPSPTRAAQAQERLESLEAAGVK